MKIGVLGSGDVAKTLAAGFVANGHSVMMGTFCFTRFAQPCQ
jgi:predicted dinucleotide-binding enzyme